MSVTLALVGDTKPMPHPGENFQNALRDHLEEEIDACCITLNVLRGYRRDFFEEYEMIPVEEMERVNAFIKAAEAHWTEREAEDDWYIVMTYQLDGEGVEQIHFAEPLYHVPSPGWDFFSRQLSYNFDGLDPLASVSLESLRERVELYQDEDRATAEQAVYAHDFLEAAERVWSKFGRRAGDELLMWADLPLG